MDSIIAGRTTYFEVEISPTPTNLVASEVTFRLLRGEVALEEEAGAVLSENTVSFTIDAILTEDLTEGIYIFEVLYEHDGNIDRVIDGTVNVLRRL